MRRLHPLSAASSVVGGIARGAFFGVLTASVLAGPLGLPGWLVPLLVPVGATLGGGLAIARYYRFTYEISGSTLTVESGVIARQSREIPLGRIQNVDARQGVLNRALGLTVVAFETAGGAATEATLDAVDEAEAERIRRAVRQHGDSEEAADRPAEAEDGATGVSGSDTETPRERPEAEELFAFSLRDLLIYAVVSIRPAAPALLLAGLPLGIDILRSVARFNLGTVGGTPALSSDVLAALGPTQLLGLAALTVAQFLVAALALSIALTVVEYHGFRLERDGDDLRYERGLVRRYSGAIPLAKVQTLTVRENVLMRRFGLATLVVETAGYSGGGDGTGQGVAIPMAPRDTVYELARDIEPFGELSVERPPKRARRRYTARFAILAGVLTAAGYLVDTMLLATGYWWLLLGLFGVVVPAAHYRWRHRGYALGDDVLATRSGFWRQTTRVVPYYRLQTVFVSRSPFQRRRRLASLTADTASSSSILGSSATAHDLDADTAVELREALRRRLYDDLLARKAEIDTADTVTSEPNVAADEAVSPEEDSASEGSHVDSAGDGYTDDSVHE